MSLSKDAHSRDASAVLAHFSVSPTVGLTPAQVDSALRLHGRNEIPIPPTTSLWKLILEQFEDLLVLILLAAAVISFVLALFEDSSDDRWTAFVEPAVILIILVANAAVGVVQETNAAQAIEKLKQSEAREANVVRDGHTKTIHSVDVVPGDVVVVSEGVKVPADCRLVSLSSATLSVDESMLTGESEAASKHPATITKPNAVNQDKRNMLFSGTLVVKGKGVGVVVATGAHTEMGAIAHALGSETETKTPLQQRLDEFGEQLSKVIGVICVVVWLINIGHFTDPDHGSVFRGAIYYFKIAVALAVAAIPEGLPAVVTTCLTGDHRVLTRGGWRSISRVEVGDEVLSFNVKTSAQEWSLVTARTSHRIDRRQASHQLYRMQGSGMDVVATRDHRMLVARVNPNNETGLIARGEPVVYETVGELLQLSYAVKSTSKATRFPQSRTRAVVRTGTNPQTPVKIVIPRLERVCEWWWAKDYQLGFLRFVGFWLGDGYLNVRDGIVCIEQKKETSVAWLEQLLEDVFPSWWYSSEDSTKPGMLTYVIRCPPLYSYLRHMAIGPLGYNPRDPSQLRRYPHFIQDDGLAAGELQSAYHNPPRIGSIKGTWTQDAMLAAMSRATGGDGIIRTATGEERLSRDVVCAICRFDQHEELLLLCDGCDGAYHTHCLDRPLPVVPAGEWYCDQCRPSVADPSDPCLRWEKPAPMGTDDSAAAVPAVTESMEEQVVTESMEEQEAVNAADVDDDDAEEVLLGRATGPTATKDEAVARKWRAVGKVVWYYQPEPAVPLQVAPVAVAVAPVSPPALPPPVSVPAGVSIPASAAIVPWNSGWWIIIGGHWFYLKRWLGDQQQIKDVYSQLSKEQAVALLEGFCRADGRWSSVQFDHNREPTGRWHCTNSSFPLIDHLQLIGQLAGATVDLSVHSKGGHTIGDRIVTLSVDHWALDFNFNTTGSIQQMRTSPLAQPVDVSDDVAQRGYHEYEDDGRVYCITVEGNNNFLTQRLSLKRLESDRIGVKAHPLFIGNCLALGTMKMARKNAIVRSLPSVETLGCTTVICSDKTGTLTTNMMSVVRVLTVDRADHHRVITREFIVEGDSWSPIGAVIEHKHSDLNGGLEIKGAASLPVLMQESHTGRRVTALDDAGLAEISKISALCNEATLGYKQADPATNTAGSFTKTGAPTEAALLVLAEKVGVPEARLNDSNFHLADPEARAQAAFNYWRGQWETEHVLEFDRDRKSMSVVCRQAATGDRWLFCKGAPESVLARCTHVKDERGEVNSLTPAMVGELNHRMEAYAREGLRCLALAEVHHPSTRDDDFLDSNRYRSLEDRMTFIGLAMMMDPPRQAVNASILKCRTAGIRVIVITGDNQVTAESICRRIGLFSADESTAGKSFTGTEFELMGERERLAAVKSAALFSRVEPKHKLQIVRLLQGHTQASVKGGLEQSRQGEVVAMTGDGVNDAAALREADIGIAMGSGTDVAREASKMVLQDDNFATIVMAVEEGRAIYANCFSEEEHQLLTSHGFMFLRDVEAHLAQHGTLEVGTYVDGALSYHPITARDLTIAHVTNQRCVEMRSTSSNGHVSLMPTDNHRMYVRLGATESLHEEGRAWTGRIQPALAIHSAADVLAAGQADRSTVAQFVASFAKGAQVTVEAEPLPFVTALDLRTEDEIEAFLELYGYWLQNGWLAFGDAPCVCFDARREMDREYLVDLLARLPVSVHRQQLSESGQRVFAISSPAWVGVFGEEYHHQYAHGDEWWATFSAVPRPVPRRIQKEADAVWEALINDTITMPDDEMLHRSASSATASPPASPSSSPVAGRPTSPSASESTRFSEFELQSVELCLSQDAGKDADDKWLAHWAKRRLSAAQCRRVLDGLRCADGEQAHDCTGGIIYTSSERLRDEVVHLALHAGCAAHYQLRSQAGTRTGAHSNGESMVAAKAGWQVNYSTDAAVAAPRLTVAEECCERTYTGRVWCVTVPSELVMFRRVWMEDGVLLASRPVVVGNTKQFIRYLISSNIGEVACIFLTAMIGMPEALIPVQLLWVNLVTDGLPATALGFNPPDQDIMLKPPRGRTESIINRWMFFRYVAVGLYVGIGTVSGFIWWFLYASNGPHITWAQLTDFHSCDTGGENFTSLLARGLTCDIFHDPRPSTVSLSILVTIEMFNALNALSENQSLLTVTPLSNLYVVLACVLSFLLHITIVYVPFLAGIFHVAPLNAEEWLHVLYLSVPILLLDELLKAVSRYTTAEMLETRKRINAQLLGVPIVNTHNPQLIALTSSSFDQLSNVPIEHTTDTPSIFTNAPSTQSPAHGRMSYAAHLSTLVPDSVVTLPWYQRLMRRSAGMQGVAVKGGTAAEGAEEGPTPEMDHLLKKV